MDDELNFYNRSDDTRLVGREYSNGTSQIKVINEIKEAFNSGEKIVILVAGAGSGKSVCGLEVVRAFGNGYITVPRIYHQDQYKRDYSDDDSRLYMKDKNGDIIKIHTFKGKNNFKCKIVLQDQIDKNPMAEFCDFTNHICNTKATIKTKLDVCHHFMSNTPVNEEEYDDDDFLLTKKKNLSKNSVEYYSIDGERILDKNCEVEDICFYHKNFYDSINSDIVIINSKKLEIECAIGRLPQKKVLVIDEFDLFLKELSSPKQVNFSKLISSIQKALRGVSVGESKEQEILMKIKDIIEQEIKRTIKINKYNKEEINPIYKGQVFDFKTNIFEDSINNIIKLFEIFEENDFLKEIKGLEDTYNSIVYNSISLNDINFYYDLDKDLKLMLFSLNTSSMVNSIFSKFDHVLLMSATKQSDIILSEFYGIKNYKLINGEETIVGTMFNASLGCETSFKKMPKEEGDSWGDYFQKERERHLRATSEIIGRTRNMTIGGNLKKLKRLFHISAFHRLPTETDINEFPLLSELGSKLEDSKDEDSLFDEFKDSESDNNLHKSTKMFRAIDLPDDLCRVIIFQKLPYSPPTPFHDAISRKYSVQFKWDLLNDECYRELIQGATRGIRNANDWCVVVSPDIRVNETIGKILHGNNRVVNCTFPDGKIEFK